MTKKAEKGSKQSEPKREPKLAKETLKDLDARKKGEGVQGGAYKGNDGDGGIHGGFNGDGG